MQTLQSKSVFITHDFYESSKNIQDYILELEDKLHRRNVQIADLRQQIQSYWKRIEEHLQNNSSMNGKEIMEMRKKFNA